MSTAIRLHDFRNTSLQRVTRCGELLLRLENWTSFACSGLGLGHMDTFPCPWIDKGLLGRPWDASLWDPGSRMSRSCTLAHRICHESVEPKDPRGLLLESQLQQGLQWPCARFRETCVHGLSEESTKVWTTHHSPMLMLPPWKESNVARDDIGLGIQASSDTFWRRSHWVGQNPAPEQPWRRSRTPFIVHTPVVFSEPVSARPGRTSPMCWSLSGVVKPSIEVNTSGHENSRTQSQ